MIDSKIFSDARALSVKTAFFTTFASDFFYSYRAIVFDRVTQLKSGAGIVKSVKSARNNCVLKTMGVSLACGCSA